MYGRLWEWARAWGLIGNTNDAWRVKQEASSSSEHEADVGYESAGIHEYHSRRGGGERGGMGGRGRRGSGKKAKAPSWQRMLGRGEGSESDSGEGEGEGEGEGHLLLRLSVDEGSKEEVREIAMF